MSIYVCNCGKKGVYFSPLWQNQDKVRCGPFYLLEALWSTRQPLDSSLPNASVAPHPTNLRQGQRQTVQCQAVVMVLRNSCNGHHVQQPWLSCSIFSCVFLKCFSAAFKLNATPGNTPFFFLVAHACSCAAIAKVAELPWLRCRSHQDCSACREHRTPERQRS